MPLVPLPGAKITREARSDYIETAAGKRKLRVFDGAKGTWRLTALGKRYYARNNPPSEFVVKVPAKFYTTKANGETIVHFGWYPLADLSLQLRQSIQNALRSQGGRSFSRYERRKAKSKGFSKFAHRPKNPGKGVSFYERPASHIR